MCPLPGNCVPFARSLLKVCHLIDLCYLCALRSIFVNWVAFVRTLLTVCPLLDLSRTLKKMGTTHDLLSIYLPYRPGFETVIFQLNDLTITPKVKKKQKKKKSKKTKFMDTHISPITRLVSTLQKIFFSFHNNKIFHGLPKTPERQRTK